MDHWQARDLMRDPQTGALSIRNVPREILQQYPRLFEDVICYYRDKMVYRQRRWYDPRRQEHIDRLGDEFREVRAIELEMASQEATE